jgi:Mg-chelatase subunit ChlD
MYFSKDYITENVADENTHINSNILCIKLSDILQTQPYERYPIDFQKSCFNCGLIVNYMSIRKNKKFWACENCNNYNSYKTEVVDILKSHVEFSNSLDLLNRKSIAVIFLIDVSGSMEGALLDLIKKNSIRALEQIKNKNPQHKVILITFSNKEANFVYEFKDKKWNKANTITKEDFEKGNFNKDYMKNIIENTPPIDLTFDSLAAEIRALIANGGTFITDALSHAVVLASFIENSAIIVCTDGANQDFDENITNTSNQETQFFARIAHEARKYSTKIFITRMNNCNLKKFEIISRKTGGKIQEMKDIQSNFDKTIDFILSNNLSGTVKFKLMSNIDFIEMKILHDSRVFTGTSYICVDNVKKNTDQIFVEVSLLQSKRFRVNEILSRVFFQLQLISTDSTNTLFQNRIITKTLDYINLKKVNIFLNESIIHANNLIWITHYLLECNNLQLTREYIKRFESFLIENKIHSKQSEMIIKLIMNQNFDLLNINDEVAEFLSNISNIKINEIKPAKYLQPIRCKLLRRCWLPSVAQSSKFRPKTSLSFNYNNKKDEQELVTNEKLIINSTIELPYLNCDKSPLTKIYIQKNSSVLELKPSKCTEILAQSVTFTDEIVEPLKLINSVRIFK